MALSQTAEVKINKPMNANQFSLLRKYNVNNLRVFSVCFVCTGVVAPLTGQFRMLVSNDGINFEQRTVSPQIVTANRAGSQTFFIYSTGVEGVRFIDADYVRNTAGGGTIVRAYINGKQ